MNTNRPAGPALALLAILLSGCSGSAGGGSASADAPVLTLTAVPSVLTTGQSTHLSWDARNASSCTASGSWSGTGPTSGSLDLLLSNPGDYIFVLTCSGSGGSDTQAAEVTVTGSPSSNTIPVTLTASPTVAPVGQQVQLTWTSTGASSCAASGAWSGSKAVSGSEMVTVPSAGQNLFAINCNSAGAAGAQSVYVTGTLPTLTLSSDVTTTKAGGTANLTWSTTYASSCTASGAWNGSKATSGSQSVTVAGVGDSDFTLSCSDGTNIVSKKATVTGSAPVVTLTVFPSKVVSGKKVTLRWNALYADACTASNAWSGSVAVSGMQTSTASTLGARTYALHCTNSAASADASATTTVSAAPAFPPATAYRMSEAHDGVVLTTDGAKLPKTTTPAWTVNLGASTSYPLIAGGKVYIATANPDGSYGNRLYALNPSTGATVWGPIAIAGTYFGSGLSYDNGKVFVLMFDGVIRAFDASTGGALWSTQMPGYWFEGSPNAYGGIVYSVGNYGMSAVDESTGTILWTTASGTTDFVSPAVSSEGVYFMDGYYCQASAYNPISGGKFWQNAGVCGGSFGYTPVIKNGVLFGRTSSSVDLFDATTGATIAQLGSAAAPAVTDTAFIALNSGTLSSTRLSDRVQTWTFMGDNGLVSAPVVVNTTAFVASSTGKVFGVDTSSGALLWTGTSSLVFARDSESGGPQPPSGPAAGEKLLVFTAGNSVIAWQFP